MSNFHTDIDIIEEHLETISSAIDDIVFALGVQEVDVATKLNDEAMIALTKKLSLLLEKKGYKRSASDIKFAAQGFIRG